MGGVQELLRGVALFRALSRRELREVAQCGEEIEFAPGSAIVTVGLEAMDFYLILDGEAELEVPKKPLMALHEGDSFGEISVLDGGPRTASITAVTRVLAFRLVREDFQELLDHHGSIARKILVEMCGRLRYAEGRMST